MGGWEEGRGGGVCVLRRGSSGQNWAVFFWEGGSFAKKCGTELNYFPPTQKFFYGCKNIKMCWTSGCAQRFGQILGRLSVLCTGRFFFFIVIAPPWGKGGDKVLAGSFLYIFLAALFRAQNWGKSGSPPLPPILRLLRFPRLMRWNPLFRCS